ncbi:MAG: hypothetical protein KGM18_01660 [Sphingomonadales bacterium]|nr:hypothetical protein [Sphingomonadales bacterium]
MNSPNLHAVRKKLDRLGPLFLFTVVVPTVLAAVYFLLLASDVYTSESRFVVRTPEKAAPTGLGALLKGGMVASASDEVSAAQSVVLSRDALRAVNAGKAYERAYASPSISIFNRFAPLGIAGSFEDLYKYFRKRVEIQTEPNSSITVLTVRAYTPTDAQKINEKLLETAEATVNRLNERARQDLIRFATREVEDAQLRATTAAQAVASYRNRSGVVDPEKQASVQAQMISKLQDELISTRTQLRELQQVAPRSPQIEALNARVDELNSAIATQSGMVAGSSRSLAATQVRYQQLQIASQTADKQLAGAITSLEDARNEARRKQSYVERVVQPSLPDSPEEPRRWRSLFATFIVGLIAYGALSMFAAGVREHKD